MKVEMIEYGRYLIRYGNSGGEARALAYRKNTKSKGQIADATGATPDEALQTLKQILDERHRERAKARRRAENIDFLIPTVEEYAEALEVLKPEGAKLDMLVAHAKSDDVGLTAGEIARAGGYDSFETANALYGRLGREIAEVLGVSAPTSTIRADDVQTGVIAQAGPARAETGAFVWVMYPELRKAVLGI
ncbi:MULTISPECIES: hypothetical protein [unclassified Roseivivax]|uniref:hypothetical protein n=1 Tax=unclassified Roseivivax TaxID=2639302 RepID=UPI0012679FA1|nr:MULTISPECIES: hypothetical protein [unclassified Roseivivax]QFS84643.1 hypothetical protein FIV09_17525 [Roseivivax sp. THAF197b]